MDTFFFFSLAQLKQGVGSWGVDLFSEVFAAQS